MEGGLEDRQKHIADIHHRKEKIQQDDRIWEKIPRETYRGGADGGEDAIRKDMSELERIVYHSDYPWGSSVLRTNKKERETMLRGEVGSSSQKYSEMPRLKAIKRTKKWISHEIFTCSPHDLSRYLTVLSCHSLSCVHSSAFSFTIAPPPQTHTLF